jgi:hypothetical protein
LNGRAYNFVFALFFPLFFCNSVFSQIIKGKVINEADKKPVPFAVVVVDRSNKGTMSDIDGNFVLTLNGTEKEITVQVIGFNTKTIALSDQNLSEALSVKMKPGNINLSEVIVTPKENPAIPIIRKVIKYKPKYDINNLKYYFCNTYAKTYFTLSDQSGDENFYTKDTSRSKLKKFLDNNYLFFMESVTEKKYIYKNKSQEKVLSSRISGFKSAPFGSFASQLQSFTFYNDNIEVLGLKYVSPLISGTFKRYNFEIIDTVFTNADTTILIKFSPKKKSNFKGMKGVLYISKNDYALGSVLAEPAEVDKTGTGVKIQQLYERIDSVHWFPRQVNTEIMFNSVKASSSENSGEKTSSIIKGVSKLYVKEIKLDSVFKIKNKSVEVYNATDFDKKDEAFWNKYRTDSLNKKEIRTYNLIDSVGKAQKFDKKLKWLNALTTGKWQIGYLNLDLKHILRFNEYESVRLGVGLSTSDKLSRWFSIGGYGGYGFRDKAWKYGGFARINFNYSQNTFLLAEAASEVMESAGIFFLQENRSFISTDKIRDLFISKMDKVNFGKISFNSSLFNIIKSSVCFQIQQRNSPFGFFQNADYLNETEQRNFILNEAGIQLRYWPKEKYIESMGRLISSGSKWPIFHINLAKGITDKVYGYTGSFNYSRIDLKIDHQINFRIKGFLAYQIQAGKVFGNVPYSIQYNNKGSRVDNYAVSAEKTFETMYLNEFISTEYVSFFFAVNIGKIFRQNKYTNPELEFVHNYGIGNLNNRLNLTNIELNDMSKGYTEAGIRIKSILKSNFSTFGAGVLYRYGNYAYASPEKNFVYKLVLGYSF